MAWSAPPEDPYPTHRQAPDPLVLEAITGRAHQAPRFWAFAGTLAVLLLVPSGILMVWAVCFGRADTARSAQATWSILFAVVVLGALVRLSRTGTTWDGQVLRRTTLFGAASMAWSTVTGFSGGCDDRPGIWLATTTAPGKPTHVPSSMHAMAIPEAAAMADWMSAACGLPPVAPRLTRSGKPRVAGRLWIRWTWWLPLLSVGLATPIVYVVAAALTRRRWLWLAWAVSIDLLAVIMATTASSGAVQSVEAVPMTAFMTLWLCAPVVLFVVVIVTGHRLRSAATDTAVGPPTVWP